MTITQFRYIIAVDNHRHFARAAATCFVTQPTLSMQIQKLEDELGLQIFDRSKQPIVPTPLGEKIIEQARKVLHETAILKHMTKQIKGTFEGELRLAVIPTVAPSLLPRFLVEFNKAYPKIKLFVEEMKTSNMIEALRKDRIDVGIAATPLEEKGIVESHLYHEPFVAFVPNYHPMAKDKFLLASEINTDELLLLNEGHCFRNSVLSLCNPINLRSEGIHMESGHFDTLIKLADKGMGMTLLPYLTSIDLNNDRFKGSVKPIAEPTPTRQVSLIYSRAQLKLAWIEALGVIIKNQLPKKVLQQPEQVISPL